MQDDLLAFFGIAFVPTLYKAVWGEGKYSGGHQGHQTIPDHTPGDTPNNCPSERKILETNIAIKGMCQEIFDLYFLVLKAFSNTVLLRFHGDFYSENLNS